MSADTTKQMKATGIVERLRRAKDGVAPFSLWDEAADEIEQLRACVDARDDQIRTACDVADLWRDRQSNTRAALEAASFLIDEITDLEGREGLTDHDFAEQVIALAHSKRDQIRAALNPDGESR